MKRPRFGIFAVILALNLALTTGASFAAKVLLDVNQFSGPYDSASLAKLKCDGVWSIASNPEDKFTTLVKAIGSEIATEDPYNPNLVMYDATMKRIAKFKIGTLVGAFSYNEVSSSGGTVLSDEQITALMPKLGSDSNRVLVLTRSYETNWEGAVTRALNNPHVSGVTLETISSGGPTLMGAIRVAPLIKACLAKGKQFYLLSPKNENPTPYADCLKVYMTKLQEAGVDFSKDDIYLVAANYDDGPAPGIFYSANNRKGNSVEAAIALYNSVKAFPSQPSQWTYEKPVVILRAEGAFSRPRLGYGSNEKGAWMDVLGREYLHIWPLRAFLVENRVDP